MKTTKRVATKAKIESKHEKSQLFTSLLRGFRIQVMLEVSVSYVSGIP